MSSVTAVTDDSFKQGVLSSTLPALVLFSTEWSGPCRQVASMLDEIATNHAGQLEIYKLDIDQNPQISSHYIISNVPTLLLFKDGELIETMVGGISRSTLLSTLNKYI